MNAFAAGPTQCAMFAALLAIASSCGDDDGVASPARDAGEAGRDGPSGRGGSGSDRRDADAGSVTGDQCRSDAVQAAGASCLRCVCAIDPAEVLACTDTCWALVTCVHAECGGDGTDGECIGRECADHLGGVMEANTFGPVFGACAQDCAAAQSDSDAGR
jgi:hypothetical protein